MIIAIIGASHYCTEAITGELNRNTTNQVIVIDNYDATASNISGYEEVYQYNYYCLNDYDIDVELPIINHIHPRMDNVVFPRWVNPVRVYHSVIHRRMMFVKSGHLPKRIRAKRKNS